MKKSIVIYYSNNGSNRFLANKIADSLNCEVEEIKPRLDVQLFLMFGLNLGNKRIKANLSKYDLIILCGPIWMGKFIAPLKTFVEKNRSTINELVFTTCCGSSFEMKDKKFGHGLVFKEIKEMLNEKCIHCSALPIALVLPEDKREDPNAAMKTKLTDDNFKGEILDKFNDFIQFLKSQNIKQ